MAGPSPMVNDLAMEQVLIGTEPSFGAGVTPTLRLYGDLQITSKRPLVRKDQKRRTYDPFRNPRRGPWMHSGTYQDSLSFEDLAILPRYGVVSSPTPVDDTNTVHGYTRTYIPSSAAFDSLAPEYGFDGIPFAATGVQWDEFTIQHDIDDADGVWKFNSNLFVRTNAMKAQTSGVATGGSTTTAVKSGAGWTPSAFIGLYVAFRTGAANNIDEIRLITANDATTLTFAALPSAVANGDTFEISGAFTTGISERDVEPIPNEGTQLFMADDYANIAVAANEVKDKMMSFSVQQTNGLVAKRFSNNRGGNSKKRGRRNRIVVVQIKQEFDDWRERAIFETTMLPKARAIRFQQTGSTIDTGAGSTKLAQINLPNVQWDDVDTNQNRNGNRVGVYQGLAYVSDSFGGVVSYVSKTKLATLP